MSIAQSAMKAATGNAVPGLAPLTVGKKSPPKPKRKYTHRKNAKTYGQITPQIQATILSGLKAGKSLAAICRDELIDKSSVYDELARDAEFADLYMQARKVQADALFDEVLEIADRCHAGADDVQKARLQIDARKWMCGKLAPKKYNDRAALELSGENGGAIVVKIDADDARG